MIEFKLDSKGKHISDGGTRCLTVCTNCGKEKMYSLKINVSLKVCGCMKSSRMLTVNDETKRLEDWAKGDSRVVLSSARVRFYDRRSGKRNCTDSEVLYGYGKAIPILPQSLNSDVVWENELLTELSKQMVKYPLATAVIQTFKFMQNLDDGEFQSDVLTKAGCEFTFGGDTLINIVSGFRNDLQSLKDEIHTDTGLSYTEIEKLFK